MYIIYDTFILHVCKMSHQLKCAGIIRDNVMLAQYL